MVVMETACSSNLPDSDYYKEKKNILKIEVTLLSEMDTEIPANLPALIYFLINTYNFSELPVTSSAPPFSCLF